MEKLIFFVDDDKMILNLLEYTFKSRDGYKVKTFRTGEECLNSINERPSLIVLDHVFLVENSQFSSGIEILKKLREINKEVPVIMLSGIDNNTITEEYLKNGATKFIVKDSYFIDTLIESIENELAIIN
jgi:two-component system, NtrC family, response regulator AtoC